MIDGFFIVNRVLVDLGDILGIGKNSYKGVEIGLIIIILELGLI